MTNGNSLHCDGRRLGVLANRGSFNGKYDEGLPELKLPLDTPEELRIENAAAC